MTFGRQFNPNECNKPDTGIQDILQLAVKLGTFGIKGSVETPTETTEGFELPRRRSFPDSAFKLCTSSGNLKQ